jgi:hypothetical protein
MELINGNVDLPLLKSQKIFSKERDKISWQHKKQKVYELENSPPKKSNHKRATNYFFENWRNSYLIIYCFGLSQKKEVLRNAISKGL